MRESFDVRELVVLTGGVRVRSRASGSVSALRGKRRSGRRESLSSASDLDTILSAARAVVRWSNGIRRR